VVARLQVAGTVLVDDGLAATVTDRGTVVRQTSARPAFRRRSPAPPRAAPRPVLGREGDLAQIGAASGPGSPVELYGPSGIGKTTLLRELGQPGSAGPGDRLLLRVGGAPLDDVLQALVESLYETGDEVVVPSPTRRRDLLGAIDARILLDDSGLGRDDLEEVVDALPSASVVVGLEHPVLLGGPDLCLRVAGLGEDDAVALVESRLGAPVGPGDREALVAVAAGLGGNPGLLLQSAHRVREGESSWAALAAAVRGGAMGAFAGPSASMSMLGAARNRVTGLLGALGGAPLAAPTIVAVVGPGAEEALAELEDERVIERASPRFRLRVPPGPETAAGAALVEELADHLARRAGSLWDPQAPRDRRDEIRETADDAEAIVTLLERRAGDPAGALELATSVAPALAVSGRWGAWERTLDAQRAAAARLGDEAALGVALHELGTRALCRGDASARGLLERALEVRERLGDRDGAALTRHNLGMLPGGGATDGSSGNGGPPPGGHRRRWAIALGALVVVVAVIVGVVVATNGDGGGGDEQAGLTLDPSDEITLTAEPGQIAELQTVRVTASGPTGALRVSRAGNAPRPFSVDASGCAAPLDDGGSCTLSVGFDASRATAPISDALLVVQSASAGTAQVPLRGIVAGTTTETTTTTTTAPAAADPDITPRVAITWNGTSGSTGTVTLANRGGQPMDVGAASLQIGPPTFEIANDACSGTTLGPGEECAIDVGFMPPATAASASFSDTLVVPVDGFPNETSTVIGTVVPPTEPTPPPSPIG
jgi:hypothetical protein